MKLAVKESELHLKIKDLVSVERRTLRQIIEHLQIVYDTKLYAKLGHSTLQKYLIKELGYSESAAYRRYRALRLTKEMPESKEMIESGSLSLTNASTFHSLMKGLDQKTKEKALGEIQNKTSEETRNKLFDYVPDKEQNKTDEKSHVGKDTYQIKVTLSACIVDKMKCLKARTKIYDTEALLDRVLDIALRETDLTRKKTRKSKSSKHQRHVSAALKKELLARARYRCEHPGCDEVNYLEIDHIRPIAYGGQSNLENLRLVCRSHNQLYAKSMGLGTECFSQVEKKPKQKTWQR